MALFDDIPTQLSSPATGDYVLARDVSVVGAGDQIKYMNLSQLGVLALAQTWTAKQTFGEVGLPTSVTGLVSSLSIANGVTSEVATLQSRSVYLVHSRRNGSFNTMAVAIVSTGTEIVGISSIYASGLTFVDNGALSLAVTNGSSTDTIVTSVWCFRN